MSSASRIVHCKLSPYDIYIGRGGGGKWGNPFVIGKHGSRREVIDRYEEWIKTQPELMDSLPELRGKVLGCWCRPANECHGDVLVRLLEEMDAGIAPKGAPDGAKAS